MPDITDPLTEYHTRSPEHMVAIYDSLFTQPTTASAEKCKSQELCVHAAPQLHTSAIRS